MTVAEPGLWQVTKAPDQVLLKCEAFEQGSASRLTVHCICDLKGFRDLEGEWSALFERCDDRTPFNSWEWLFSWWQSYGAGSLLRIVTFRQDGELVGIVPLYLSKQKSEFGLGCRLLRLVGDGSADSDYLGWLVPEKRNADIASAFGKWLNASDEWDALLLREIANRSAMPVVLKTAMTPGRLLVRSDYGLCAALELPASIESFLRARQGRFRTKLRALLKRLDEGDILCELDCSTSTLRRRLRSLFELHQARWQSAGEPGVFGKRSKRLFYARFATRYHRRGWLRLYSLRINESYLAHQLCFQEGDTVYLLQEGFDVENPSCSYGQMLRAAVIRHLIDVGVKRYDFLGGYSRHKEIWGAHQEPSQHIVIARTSLRGRAYFYGPLLREKCAAFVKRILPPAFAAWARRGAEN